MSDDPAVLCRYALAFVGLSITEVVSSSLTVVGGERWSLQHSELCLISSKLAD